MGVRPTVDLLTCSNCGGRVPEAESEDAGRRFYSDGVGELLPFCALCVLREFAQDAPASA